MIFKYVDTHCHLDSPHYDEDREEVFADIEKNMEFVVNIGCNIESSKVSVEYSEKYKNVFAAVGVHPTEVAGNFTKEIYDELKKLATSNEKVVAIGEIGLDYHHMTAEKEIQKDWFRGQMKLAEELKKSVVIHSRDAIADTVEILKEFPKVGGIVHCYPGSYETALEIMDRYYFGIGGVITFKSARKTNEAVRQIPLEKLVIETDAPYLTPEPYRSKRNMPQYVNYVVERIAEVKGISPEEVLKITTENARKVFGL